MPMIVTLPSFVNPSKKPPGLLQSFLWVSLCGRGWEMGCKKRNAFLEQACVLGERMG